MTAAAPLTPAERAGCWANLIGAAVGTAAAGAIFFSDPRRWLEYTPSATPPTDAQFYTFMGGVVAAFVASGILARVHPLARTAVVAWWVMLGWLLAVKCIGMLLGIGA